VITDIWAHMGCRGCHLLRDCVKHLVTC
jgi:hypothetical protein